jgi:hypothetical protein
MRWPKCHRDAEAARRSFARLCANTLERYEGKQ